ncbi:MAG: hypothetical protein Q9219_002078 [cf. Caloplaca sp. 3 TL-2023]
MSNLPLPVIDLSVLSLPHTQNDDIIVLAAKLGKAFQREEFAYLVNMPLTFSHGQVFDLAQSFFKLPSAEKLRLAKRNFRGTNCNTYRGFFPARTGSGNLKEGFEVGPPGPLIELEQSRRKVDLTETNIWPNETSTPRIRAATEKLRTELQDLSSKLLQLLAIALEKDQSYFDHFLHGSVSTLRYLHYPAINPPHSLQELCCTPHTDSGILTLLHQDNTGGLEVLNPDGRWVAAPYVPGSLVVNIGDLMAKISGGRFRATYRRVRSLPGLERDSVPFFFEPGIDCKIQNVDGDSEVILYGEHVLAKMKDWVEFQDSERSMGIVENALVIDPAAA